MKSKLNLTIIAFAAVVSLLLPQIAGAPPAEAGRGFALYWKQKRAKQAEQRRLLRVQSKSHAHKFDPATQALRLRMFAGKALSPKQLKFLADKGEELAAVRYAQANQMSGGPPSVTIHYFAKAAAQGRKDTVKPLLALVRTPGAKLQAADLGKAEKSLASLIKRGNTDAMTGLARLYLTGTPFGHDNKKAVELLVMAAQHGDADAAVQAGLLLEASGTRPEELSRAVEMYRIAAKRGNIVALAKLESLAPVN